MHRLPNPKQSKSKCYQIHVFNVPGSHIQKYKFTCTKTLKTLHVYNKLTYSEACLKNSYKNKL